MWGKGYKVINSRLFTGVVVLLMLITLFSQADHRYGYTSKIEKGPTPIASDGSGYYAYLPQYVVYPDSVHFSFYDDIHTKYPDKRFFDMLLIDHEKQQASNKFYTGTVLMQLPFYYVAHKLHQWNGWDADGYQLGYRFSIQLAGLFYWLLGVLALFRLFMAQGFSRFSILLAVGAITFGTNLNMYVSYWVSMSHVYSFSMVACFLAVAYRWTHEYRPSALIWMLFFLGMIAVVRPVNVLVVCMVPFLFTDLKSFWRRFLETFQKQWKPLALGVLLFLIPISIQVLVQYHQTGKMGLYTYKEEGFTNALTPQFWNVLFSFEKGFFVYAPIMLLLFPGLYYFYRKSSPHFFMGWLITTFVWLYAVSSWWCWDYGGGLGMRALVEFLPLFFFPLICLFKYAGNWLKSVTVIFAAYSIYVYQVYQFQFNESILHSSQMNKHYFWYIFGKTDLRYKWMIDFDLMREKLPEESVKPRWKLGFSKKGWEVLDAPPDSTLVSTGVFSEIPFANYTVPEGQTQFMGVFEGEVHLKNPEKNPFLSIRYLNDAGLVEESFLTIGSDIDDPYRFEAFRVEANHPIAGKGITRIELIYNQAGGELDIRNATFTAVEP